MPECLLGHGHFVKERQLKDKVLEDYGFSQFKGTSPRQRKKQKQYKKNS
jgi:hypothetical protein